ncbi:restriction endonuclease subunit S [Acinetobacter soli]|uniref:restriction endonuclease subunit S n=3 Tax=Acinetobacter TaxID=469 RepID=UPI00125FB67D|nr:restriction endonuclease subunit S [Acinetobacter soli]
MNNKNLPSKWIKTTLGEVFTWMSGGTPARSNSSYYGGNIPWVTITDLNDGLVINTHNYLTDIAIENSSAKLIPANSVMIGLYGSIGKLGIAGRELTTNQAIASAIPNFKEFNSKFLFYYLAYSKQNLAKLGSGVTQKNIYISNLKEYEFYLPPFQEQKRITDKIDELFSELDNGIEELETAQKKLELYRQSLLKSAVEGELSKEWRETQAEFSETGEQLLARILKKRRESWEQEKLKEFAEKGKNPPKDWQDKYPEPVKPDTENLPQLPEGWVWASLDMIGEIVSGVAKGTKRATPVPMREVPYLRVANVQRGYLDLTEIKTILATEKDINQLTLKEGDILFNEGGDRDKLGRGWIWKSEIENCIHQNHVFRCRLYEPNFVPELISYHGNTFGKLWFERAGKQTTNLASINMGILKRFPVPVMPILEQNFIFDYIQSNLDMVDSQLEQNSELIKNCSKQRTNILNQAFQGKLVTQDPNDESAQKLLQRIQQQREVEALAKKALPKKRSTQKVKKEVAMSKNIIDILKNQSDWISGQALATAFGLNGNSRIEEIEQFYEQLRRLSLDDKIMVKPDQQNNKEQDLIKLKDKTDAS